MMRIGSGWDSHRLVAGRPLILGGVSIPFPRGLAGHSDADVLLHALIDALFGAAALGDIGSHFPDTEEAYRGANSLQLLRCCATQLSAAGYSIINVDTTVIAERPKLAPHIMAMRQNIATALALPIERVSVKAKTAEGLDSVGSGAAIQAQAIALLETAEP